MCFLKTINHFNFAYISESFAADIFIENFFFSFKIFLSKLTKI